MRHGREGESESWLRVKLADLNGLAGVEGYVFHMQAASPESIECHKWHDVASRQGLCFGTRLSAKARRAVVRTKAEGEPLSHQPTSNRRSASFSQIKGLNKELVVVGGKQESLRAIKLQVERQTHLPASRYEAWEALRAMLPGDLWRENAQVFAALESIYR